MDAGGVPTAEGTVSFPPPTLAERQRLVGPATGFSKQLWKLGGMTYTLVMKITAKLRVFFSSAYQSDCRH